MRKIGTQIVDLTNIGPDALAELTQINLSAIMSLAYR